MQEPAGVVDSESTEVETADTLKKVRALLQERYGIDEHQVEMSSELTTLGLDSLSLVEYAFDLENSLQIQLTDLPHALTTIGDLVRYVDQVRRRTGTSLAA
jgi:acyl carrier protein